MKTYFPYGPPIGYAKLPDELVNDFNKGCDNIVKDKELSKSEDWSHQLVGQVEQELLIPKDIIWTKATHQPAAVSLWRGMVQNLAVGEIAPSSPTTLT